MTEREQFEAWLPVPRGLQFIAGSYSSFVLYADPHKYAEHARDFAEYNAAWTTWQSSRRAALEEAAAKCDALAQQQVDDMRLFEDERHGVYAKKYRTAAAEIRALAE
jgi:hypothetical protein